MKTIKYLFSFCLVALTFAGCVEDEKDLNFVTNVEAPTEVSMLFQVTQDNTGTVTIIPTAQGAYTFDVVLGDDTVDPVSVENGSRTSNIYEEGTYTVTATAYGITGLETTISQELVVSFQAPANLVVTIENDAAISKRVNITANADFAVSYDVHSGEESATEPVTANIGDTVSLDYAEAGTYTITVEVMGAAIETTTYTEEFEVTAIEAPLASAPAPPSREEGDVISIYSGVYTNITDVDFFPNWDQTTLFNEFDLEGDTMLQYSDLNYQGIDFTSNPVDASSMEYIHVDIWTSDENEAIISPISTGPNETAYELDLTAQQWTSFDIPLSEFTDQNPDVDFADVIQFKLEGSPVGGAIFVDNLYFYRDPAGPSPLIGTWRVASEAGSLGVGPTQGTTNWWSITADQVIDRACFLDDTYVFGADGSFSNVVGDDTWLETWQDGVEEEACGAPVAPHNGTNAATFSHDQPGGNLTITGLGAYLGLPKVHNEGEDGMPVNNTITYSVTMEDSDSITLEIEAGSGVWWTYKLVKDAAPPSPLAGSWSVVSEAGSLGVGPTQGTTNWWSITAEQVIERTCFFDDTYVFGADGSFSNVLGADSWLETWQVDVEEEGCGAPVAPHNGSNAATHSYDEVASTLTITGAGAYLGLPKVNNENELGTPVDDTITYLVTMADSNTMTLEIEAGTGVWWTFLLIKN